ncbi:inosose dehydratase [Spirochaetota bacterium]|nr:inosose dehydratase [Spirochaetota bacterium]
MLLKNAKLGIAPLTWTNDDKPEIGKENTFAQCLSEMALAGYEGCEIGSQFPKDIETLKFELELRGLRIANQWFSFTATCDTVSAVQEAFLKHIRFLKALGTNIVGGGEFGRSIVALESVPIVNETQPSRPILTAAEWKTFAERIEALGKIAYNEGMTLCFHHHMGTCVETVEETERLLNDCDSKYVSLNYDSGHFYFAGANPLSALKKFVTRVSHVHLKNVRPEVLATVKTQKLSFLAAVMAGIFTIPGDSAGAIDFKELFYVLDAIKNSGTDHNSYSNWLIVEAEQDPRKAHPLKTALSARAYLKETLGH